MEGETAITKRTVVIVGVLAALALAWADPAAAQTYPEPPQHRLVATSHGVSVQANLYTFCRSSTQPGAPGTGLCADGLPYPTANRLPVHGGGAVAITTAVPVYAIRALFYIVNERREILLKTSALDTSGRRFVATLPSGPPRPLLLVSIRYRDVAAANGGRESGDAHFSVSLTEHRHPKTKPLRVTARARLRCAAPGARRRRCRLSERGEVRRPAASAADCRGGRVLIRVLARGRGRLRTTVPTSANCRYRLRNRPFTLPRGANRVLIKTSFLGNATLTSKRARSIRFHVRPR